MDFRWRPFFIVRQNSLLGGNEHISHPPQTPPLNWQPQCWGGEQQRLAKCIFGDGQKQASRKKPRKALKVQTWAVGTQSEDQFVISTLPDGTILFFSAVALFYTYFYHSIWSEDRQCSPNVQRFHINCGKICYGTFWNILVYLRFWNKDFTATVANKLNSSCRLLQRWKAEKNLTFLQKDLLLFFFW